MHTIHIHALKVVSLINIYYNALIHIDNSIFYSYCFHGFVEIDIRYMSFVIFNKHLIKIFFLKREKEINKQKEKYAIKILLQESYTSHECYHYNFIRHI